MENNQYKIKHPYIKVFFTAYIMFLITMLPILILSKGAYLYAGDYNYQTIPFIEHGSRLFHSGEPFPLYDWQSSLGMNTLTAYGGYFFSPFSLLMFTVPVKILKYFHTFVVALKMGITALGTYIYCRQYVKQDRSAFICGILYAFSGFQVFNLVYPFMDTIALFPLTLYAFDQLMYKRRSGWFAVMLCINGIISTYFLWQECVFILIYFLVRVIMKTYPGFDLKLFFKLAFETLVGVGITAAGMFVGLISLSGNSRAGKLIFESNLMAYEVPGVIHKMLTMMIFPPHQCGQAWYFTDRGVALDPPNLYIPLFLIIGVIAVIKRDKKTWYSVSLLIFLIMASIPVLNSIFSAFNANYYARWFFMPLLIMIMITGLYIDEINSFDVKKEMMIIGIALAFLLVWGIYAVFFTDETKDQQLLWRISLTFAILSFLILYVIVTPGVKVRFISQKNLTPIVCVLCCVMFLA
ncbi:MAG: YfhO family protein, partial [Ruminococcus sp.]|nr:YfhO family protein [Ruminococcus sp.]